MIEILVSGVTVGVVYALIAVAIVITFNVIGLYDFSVGAVAMLAGMTAATVVTATASPFLALLAALAIALLAACATALLVVWTKDRLSPLSLLLVTVGIALVLEGIGVLLWGPARVRFPAPVGGALELPVGRITYYSLVLLVLASIIGIVLWLILRRTSVGRVVRANALDSVTVRLMGVRPNALAFGAIVVAGAFAGLVGFLITPVIGMGYADGIGLSVTGVVVAIIAGTYSPSGAIAVGILLGILESLAAGYLPSGSSGIASYVVLLIVLLLRPQGLFGTASAKRV